MADIAWPEQVDVILTLMDGWTPITREDLDVYQDLTMKLQEVLGSGYVNIGKTAVGPAGNSGSVSERLGRFLDPGGQMFDIAYVSGSASLGHFSEDGSGAFIGFGKALTNKAGFGEDAFAVLFSVKSPMTEEEFSIQKWQPDAPALWWVEARAKDGVWIKARKTDGSAIQTTDSGQVQYALLAIGYGAFSKGRLII